jgi:membrane protease YdiL (CAAX protease family)
MTLNVSQVYLRIASFLIPLPFGMAAFAFGKIGYRGAFALGVLTAMISVTGMFAVVAHADGTSMIPDSWREWRETIEYGLSIALSFLTGNILATLVLVALPSTIAAGGKPNAAAYRIARMLGQHVGRETMRRRARRIQDLIQMVAPLAGVVVTAAGSIYTGLKGVFGP